MHRQAVEGADLAPGSSDRTMDQFLDFEGLWGEAADGNHFDIGHDDDDDAEMDGLHLELEYNSEDEDDHDNDNDNDDHLSEGEDLGFQFGEGIPFANDDEEAEEDEFHPTDRQPWTIDPLPSSPPHDPTGMGVLILGEEGILDCPDVFQEPIRYSLPCIVRASRTRHLWHGVLLDEERVIGVIVSVYLYLRVFFAKYRGTNTDVFSVPYIRRRIR